MSIRSVVTRPDALAVGAPLSAAVGLLVRSARRDKDDDMSDAITLCSVALECPDAGELAAFYARMTGGKVTFCDVDWATVRCPGGRIDFQTSPGYVSPGWPDQASSMQAHLDFDVDDLDAAEARALAAGATRFDFQPGEHFRVYADPAGHPFCLTTQDVPEET